MPIRTNRHFTVFCRISVLPRSVSVAAGQCLFSPIEHVESVFFDLGNVWEVKYCNLVIVHIGWRLSVQRELDSSVQYLCYFSPEVMTN